MLKLPGSEQSLWREAYPRPLYPKLSENLEVDVAIIGAGITGLTSAYLLVQAGFKVAVLDKDTIGGGTTGRTTGKVTSQHGLIYEQLHQQIGERSARLYSEANQAAVEQVEKIIKKEKIDCDYERCDNYVFTADPSKIKQFKGEAKIAAKLGLPASFETDLPLPFQVLGAVKFANQGRISSQKYLIGLATAIQAKGGLIFEDSNVSGIRDGKICRVRTSQAAVTSKHIIVATNVPTLPLLARGGYCLLEYPTESYIVAGRLEKDMLGMYISPDSSHYSILPVNFKGQRFILIGGGGHLSGLRGNKQARYQRLADYAEKHFGVTSISHRWSDRDYLAYDKVPLIGKLYPWSRNLYVATAFKKWGLSGGTVAAMILSDLINGKENPWARVFAPQRIKPILSIPKAVAEQAKELFKS